jgi:acyl-coenzyme A thioesterase PaaI-like protein
VGRPISTEYVQARRILTGVVDPSGFGLVFELDGNRVYARAEATERIAGRGQVIPPGSACALLDDAAHATVAALKKRVGFTRECRLRLVKPLYADKPFRVDATLGRDSGELFVVSVRVVNEREQLCVEGEVEFFSLSAEQVRKMTPDGMIPPELKRYLP